MIIITRTEIESLKTSRQLVETIKEIFRFLLARQKGWLIPIVIVLFLVGSVLFSGSLYALSLTGVRLWGAVTPLGGIALIAGWLVLAWGLWRGRVTA